MRAKHPETDFSVARPEQDAKGVWTHPMGRVFTPFGVPQGVPPNGEGLNLF
jgi:hypothetical protein